MAGSPPIIRLLPNRFWGASQALLLGQGEMTGEGVCLMMGILWPKDWGLKKECENEAVDRHICRFNLGYCPRVLVGIRHFLCILC